MFSLIHKLKYAWYRLRFNHSELFNHKPVHLDLELVRACNLKCPFCYRQSPEFKFENKYMLVKTAGDILNKKYFEGFRSVKFNWRGEPLLHQRIGLLARYAKQIGYLDMMINTNLALPELTNDFFEHLDCFTEIRVSLDTMIPELYSEMRPPAKLETVLKNLVELIKRYNSKKTRLIIQRRTNEDCEDDISFRKKFNQEVAKCGKNIFDYIGFNSKPIQPRGLNKDESYFNLWRQGKVERQYCKQPSQRVVVGVDGKEWTCCLAYNEDPGLSDNNRRYLQTYLPRLKSPSKTFGFPQTCSNCTSPTAYKEME